MKKHLDLKIILGLALVCTPFMASAHHIVHLAPLDGGISFLAVAGIGYGLKKYNDQRKRSKNK